MSIAVAAFLLAFILSNILTPFIRQVASKIGFVDRPDGVRKVQANAVALGGGIAIIVATPVITGLLAWMVGKDILLTTPKYSFDAKFPWSLVGLGSAGALLTVVGIIDDRFGMRGTYKILWQILAVAFVVGSGLHVTRLGVLSSVVDLYYLGSIVTMVWLLGSINSFNLIDGVDGLAGSVGVVFSLTLGALALHANLMLDAILVFALAGALLGFLRYNYPPATIYLGDTGSMFIGLVLGTVALRCSTKQAATVAFSVPIAIWAIPIFDSFAAILRRKLTGRSIYTTDRGHFHHILLTRGMKPGQAVAMITGLCALTSLAAYIGVRLNNDWIGIVAVIVVIAGLVFTKVFGHVEFLLLNSRLQGIGRYFKPNGKSGESSISLQGSRQWETFWGTLVESTDRFNILKMRLNLSLPKLQEDFYATWQRPDIRSENIFWSMDLPLVVDGVPVGRLHATGSPKTLSSSSQMSEFISFVETLESELHVTIMRDLERLKPKKGDEESPESDSTKPGVSVGS